MSPNIAICPAKSYHAKRLSRSGFTSERTQRTSAAGLRGVGCGARPLPDGGSQGRPFCAEVGVSEEDRPRQRVGIAEKPRTVSLPRQLIVSAFWLVVLWLVVAGVGWLVGQ